MQDLSNEVNESVLGNLDIVTKEAPAWAKAWHTWALFNVQALEHFSKSDTEAASHYVAPAVTGFFKAVSLGQYGGELQLPTLLSVFCCTLHQALLFLSHSSVSSQGTDNILQL